MTIGSNEKSGWLADLILREMTRFENDTGETIDDVVVSRIDGSLTSVKLGIRRQYDKN